MTAGASGAEEQRRPARALFAVVVCTKDRADLVVPTLRALAAQSDTGFDVILVDQSAPPDERVERLVADSSNIALMRDHGTGISRARNLAWRSTEARWIVFLDDDCVPEPGWAAALREELALHDEADYVSGQVLPGGEPQTDYLAVTTLEFDEPHTYSSRWTRPWRMGFGACMAVKRSMLDRLDGWDERLGPGNADFPASEDMDVNWRLMRAGGVAYLTPRPRVHHMQWRRHEDLPSHYRRYTQGWCGFALKQLRTGDPLGGLYLLGARARGILKLLLRAARERSPLLFAIARAEIAGYVEGTARAIARRW